MPFHALTDAPCLRLGAKLNVMAVPQAKDAPPARMAAGARLTIRFGHCCPDVAEGIITSLTAEPERAVLRLRDVDWTLEPGPAGSGVSLPGIVSEHWFVREPAQR